MTRGPWRGPIVHGGVLAVALLFAWRTWTRPKAEPKRATEVTIWDGRAADVTTVEYAGDKRSARVERKSDAGEPYVWVTVERDKAVSAKDAAAAAALEPEKTTKAFVGGKQADELLEQWAAPRAARALGKVGAERLKDLGLSESKDRLVVVSDGKRRELRLGSKVYGGTERFVMDAKTSEVFVLSGGSLRDLEVGETSLMQRDLHRFTAAQTTGVLITAGPKTREVVRLKGSEKTDEWADAGAPDKKDEAVGTWMTKVGQLRALDYVGDEATLRAADPTAPPLEAVLRLDLRGEGGKALGYVELFRVPGEKDKYDYLARTETTRVLVKVAQRLGEQMEQDLPTLLSE
jgi:hypothetical protein